MVRFGISTHIFARFELLHIHLKKIQEAGFQAVELYANRPHFLFENEQKILEITEEIHNLGLKVTSVHSPFYAHFTEALKGNFLSICSEIERERNEAVDWIKRSLKIAEYAKFDNLIIHFGGEEKEIKDIYFDQAAKSIRELLDFIGKEKITIALENITNPISSPKALVKFLNDYDLSNVGICFDIGHSFIKDNIIDSLNRVSNYILECHIHDNSGRSDDHLIPFEGSIDWATFLAKLKEIKYDGYLIFESQGGKNPESSLQKCTPARQRFQDLLKNL